MNTRDREEIERLAQQIDGEIPLEITNYHATNKKTWTTEGHCQEETICAKKVKFLKTNSYRFYVKRCACDFYDNTHISPIYKRKLWKLAPVNQVAFDLYILFLGFGDGRGKGNTSLKHRAERNV